MAGGVESLSCVQNQLNRHMFEDAWLAKNRPEIYWTMLQTAETVAQRYRISRERQDEYGVRSQQRAAAAAAAGRFDDEIVPITVTMDVADKDSGQVVRREVTLRADEGIRPDTTFEGYRRSSPRCPGGVIAAGNASQFSDGAGACVVMERARSRPARAAPLGVFRGFAVAGCEPDEMGIGPVFAVRKLMQSTGKRIDDIDLWELNEAFAVQVIYSRDALGLPDERLNVNGGAIALGHPYGMSRSAPDRPRAARRPAPRREARRGHDVHRRRDGAAGLFEVTQGE